MTYHIGFTGSKTERPDVQMNTVNQLFLEFFKIGYSIIHLGDCVGADYQAWQRASQYFQIIVHPPINARYRAYLAGMQIREPKEYLDRNHDIVNESHVLIATPKEFQEVARSGTWATVRYARKVQKPIYFVRPDGTYILYQGATI